MTRDGLTMTLTTASALVGREQQIFKTRCYPYVPPGFVSQRLLVRTYTTLIALETRRITRSVHRGHFHKITGRTS